MTPRTPAQFLAPLTPTPKGKISSRLDANAPTFVPSQFLYSNPSLQDDQSDAEQADIKASSPPDVGSSASESGRDSPEVDNPALEYARLKLKYENLSTRGHIGNKMDAGQIHDFRKRMEALKASYFFDEKEAQMLYRVERDRADAIALQDRLRGVPSAPSPRLSAEHKSLKKRPPNLQPHAPTQPTVVADIFDDDDSSDSMTGGVFEILEDIPTSETNAQGTTISLHDMALPKHWSGRTPKILLKETVAKADRYAAVSYRLISGASRAKRAAVSIRWEGRKMDEWTMEDAACHDEGQAEQYIATVALHALTFPLTDGFAASVSAASGSQTFFRLLPAVFRDLWDDLEVARKTRDDAINRSIWGNLRSIIETKLEVNGKVCI